MNFRRLISVVIVGLLLGLSTAEVAPALFAAPSNAASHCHDCPNCPTPCKDMPPLCMTMVGCIALLTGPLVASDVVFVGKPLQHFPLALDLLDGRVIKPGLEPPILLG